MNQPQTDLQAVPSAPPLPVLLRNIALSVFLFSLVLFVLLSLSYALLLPLFTRVQVGGTPRDATGVRAYQSALAADILALERERDTSVLPLLDPAHETLKGSRRSLPSFEELREDIRRLAAALVPEPDAIHIEALRLRVADRVLEIEGDVRNVGPRSMTVLARFTDELARLPGIASVDSPVFERREDPGTGMHSPFLLIVRLP
ncbi:MAG: hypothetical protein PHW10_02750 [Candidatus Peribacteraceae bacterium]|nr:hypothetical protein [Candidatus Peribacteraceae bacterium]